jgi:DNA-directed RNA polymerase specialized sigma24 family protein
MQSDSIHSKINCLTNDEDKRQELWLHYLSSNKLDNIEKYLNNISKKEAIEYLIQRKIWLLTKYNKSNRFHDFLLKLSNVEKSVITLLALGLSITEISEYKNITEIRIQQVISVIKENDCWKELYGPKEETNT